MRTQQAEKMGTGIRRIQQALEAAGQPPAGFDYDDYNFSVTLLSTLHAGQAGTLNGALSGALNGALNEGLKQLLVTVKETPGIQRKEVVEKLGIPERTVDRHLADLVASGKVERRGSKKTGGYWAR
jgi:ATP-dependent DNA helicase RecG